MAVVDVTGLPVAFVLENSAMHEYKIFRKNLINNRMLPKTLLADKAYDGDWLFGKLEKRGIKLITPHRINRKKKSRYTRREHKMLKKRGKVEHFFAWLKNGKKVNTRYERKEINFMGMVYMGALMILIRRLKHGF
jgi:transposase